MNVVKKCNGGGVTLSPISVVEQLGSCATHVAHCDKYRRVAFTLAEVLITLAIIGVVAAMTLPTLIQQHQKQVYVNGLKKAISVSQNMLKQMQADEEASDIGSTTLFTDGICGIKVDTDCNCAYWIEANLNGCEDAYGNPSVFERIVPKYLKVVKQCKGEGCNENGIKYKNSALTCQNNKCKLTVNNNYVHSIAEGDSAQTKNITGFYTSDGMIYYLEARPSWSEYGQTKGLRVTVDINGAKGPNTYNVDLFSFIIKPDGHLDVSEYWASGVTHLMSNGWKMDY